MNGMNLQECSTTASASPAATASGASGTCCQCRTGGTNQMRVCRDRGVRPCALDRVGLEHHLGPCQWCAIWMLRWLLLVLTRGFAGYGP
ncbi:hypothetical protein ColKHC_04935 [Colletotrichum higginsianum]|nr:hypothetical protein ColKHC_04935 [Colletotrichum higginsianum]